MAARRRSRRKNPAPMITALIAGGAAILGLAAGWAIAQDDTAVDDEWNWWVSARHTTEGLFGTSIEYVPTIQSPAGEVFELTAERSEFSAVNAAERAIRERGGKPVEGKPVG